MKMLSKDHCLSINAKFCQMGKRSLINSWNWIHVISDVTLLYTEHLWQVKIDCCSRIYWAAKLAT